MKHFTILIFVLLSLVSYGQKKGKQTQPDTTAIANQKLRVENKALKTKSDSLAKENAKYYGLYTVIRDKVVKMEFDPGKMAKMIDSLQAGRESLRLGAASSAMLADSIKKQQKRIDSLRKESEGLLYTVNLLRGKPAVSPGDVKEFLGTWSLVLRKVKIEGQSPRAGIVDISEEPLAATAGPLETNPVAQITFLDQEFVELTFKNGEKGKCFYVVDGFSKTKPYFIDFKGTKADFRMYFMNTIVGPRISFQVPGADGLYYYGLMTK